MVKLTGTRTVYHKDLETLSSLILRHTLTLISQARKSTVINLGWFYFVSKTPGSSTHLSSRQCRLFKLSSTFHVYVRHVVITPPYPNTSIVSLNSNYCYTLLICVDTVSPLSEIRLIWWLRRPYIVVPGHPFLSFGTTGPPVGHPYCCMFSVFRTLTVDS